MSQRDISEVKGTSDLPAASEALFLEKVRESNAACHGGDYARAVTLYGEALQLDPSNYLIYSNRSAAFLKMGQFQHALSDAVRARDLNPNWPKAYYRQGVALQCLGKYGEALAAFSSGLAVDPKSAQLLSGLIEASMKSPLRSTLEPTFQQLEAMNLERSPFVLISVVGQELLGAGAGNYTCAVQVLEAALKIGTCSLKLRGSVFSALSSAYWALNSLDKAINYMQQDLAVAKSLGDVGGECRAHGNLGSAYFSKASFEEALQSHRYQLVLAMKCKDTQAAASALTSLGESLDHETKHELYGKAIKYHKQELTISKEVKDRNSEASTHGNLAVAYQALGAHDMALFHYRAHLNIARELKDTAGEACALLNLGNCLSSRAEFAQAVPYYENYLMLSQELHDIEGEARACHLLGYAHYCLGHYREAVRYYDQDLLLAKDLQDKTRLGRAYCNLGLAHSGLGNLDNLRRIHHSLSNTSQAIAYLQQGLQLCELLNRREEEARIRHRLGLALWSAGHLEDSRTQFEQAASLLESIRTETRIRETDYKLCLFDLQTDCYQSLQVSDSHALVCSGVQKSDPSFFSGALGLTNRMLRCYDKALGFHTQELTVRQEMQDLKGECRAHGNLGAVHMSLGNYTNAIKCYQEQLERAKELKESAMEAQAYGNLGIARLNMGHYEETSLSSDVDSKEAAGSDEALSNSAPVLDQHIQSIRDNLGLVFLEPLASRYSRELNDKVGQSDAVCGLGNVYQQKGEFQTALQYHQTDLELGLSLDLTAAQTRACGNLASVHEAMGNLDEAIKYQEQHLSIATTSNDKLAKISAFTSLGCSMVANMVVLVGGNIIGILLHTMMEHAQRKAFLDTRNCIAARLEMEDENEKLSYKSLAMSKKGIDLVFKFYIPKKRQNPGITQLLPELAN
ncbi:tetratricopeptide repeat protein 28-like [Diaphorina citri]|uniref:Tetratricopeptide repeat protein 28-like n=1 Tax=Diaphorina citri TaxID=121845 RepID=A0A3Q0IZJ6_DIACI|nr:tetratricopeptide repeat protein 28-like [Diaphorina citri]